MSTNSHQCVGMGKDYGRLLPVFPRVSGSLRLENVQPLETYVHMDVQVFYILFSNTEHAKNYLREGFLPSYAEYHIQSTWDHF